MRTLFIFGILVCSSGMIAVKFQRRIEETLPTAIFLQIFLIYIAGLFTGNLLLGVYISVAGCLLSGIYLIGKVCQNNTEVRKYCLTPGILVFLLYFLWIWWINRYRLCSSWDEFSHWGLVVKNMDIFHKFGTYKEATVQFRGYPPAACIWQYYIEQLYGGFTDGHMYQAMGWLVLSLFLPVLKNCSWRKLGYGVIIFGFMVVMPFIFFRSYIVLLYVDALLGICFGYIMLCSLLNEHLDLFQIGSMAAALFILCLIKASGLFLAVIILAAIIIKDVKIYWKERENRKKCILSWGCYIFSIAASKWSWNLHLLYSKSKEAWDISPITIQNIISLMKKEGKEYQYTTIHNFLSALSDKEFSAYIFNMNVIAWLIVMIILFLAVRAWIGENKKYNIYVKASIWGGVLYAFGLLVLYVFTYSEYEATNLASFERYLSTYFVGIGYLVMAVFFNTWFEKPDKKYIVLTASILFLFLPVKEVFKVTICNEVQVQNTQNARKQYSQFEKYMAQLDYKKDKIQFISQNTTGFDYWNLRYLSIPVQSGGGWSIGEPYSANDLWTVKCTVETWLAGLESGGYTYVYLYKIDQPFIDQFSEAFEEKGKIQAGNLYQFVKEEDKQYLKKVE